LKTANILFPVFGPGVRIVFPDRLFAVAAIDGDRRTVQSFDAAKLHRDRRRYGWSISACQETKNRSGQTPIAAEINQAR
jgi:hypothetical protein